MRICFDIDGTLCTNTDGDYVNAIPLDERVEAIKKLVSEGHEIIFCTARGTETGIDWSDLTRAQLEAWGLPSERLYFGKPSADKYVDDKGINDLTFFN
jgi:uncharacterized HAD superfamily protein